MNVRWANARCGRIDEHEPHSWTRPRLAPWIPRRTYWCWGPGVIEGGSR